MGEEGVQWRRERIRYAREATGSSAGLPWGRFHGQELSGESRHQAVEGLMTHVKGSELYSEGSGKQ